MNSIYVLMQKPESELSDFENKVVESQKLAIKAKKDLEEKVGGISFGVNMNSPGYPNLSDEKQKIEMFSYFYAIRGLVDALRYLTNNCKNELNFWQYNELFSFVKENYPQTIYGHEDIHKGWFYYNTKFKKVIDENNIPVSEEVRNTVFEGVSDEFKSLIQEYYMFSGGVGEEEAKEMADNTRFNFYYFSSHDSPEKIDEILDDIKRKQEWDDMINGESL